MTPQNAATGTSTSSLLASLRAATEENVAHLESQPIVRATELSEKIAQMEAAIDVASQIKDKHQRDDRMRILNTTLEELRKQDQAETRDFAEAVMGLDVVMKAIGGDFKALMEPSSDEKQIISRAESRLQSAQATLEAAGRKINWFGFKLREKATKLAETQVQVATVDVDRAKEQALKMARERIRSATIEQSMQQYSLLAAKALGIMEERHKETSKQLQILRVQKAQAFKVKAEAATTLEELDTKLNQMESELQSEEGVLGTLTNGSTEFVDQEAKVSALKAQVEEVRGNRNTAHVVFMSKESFASQLETHEVATRNTFDTQSVWIAKMTSDTEERRVTFASRMSQMMAVADFDVMGNTDKVGTAMDVSTASYMATSAAAAERALMDMLEDHPETMRKLEKIRAGQAEHAAKIRVRDAEVLRIFHERYGIDPFTGSFLQGTNVTGGNSPAEMAGSPA